MKKLSAIIIPTWNSEDYTIRCIKSIIENTKDFKIIWVDNGSSVESRRKVKDFLDGNSVSYELIVNEKNLGFVKATNQGMKRALDLNVDYMVLQNNDTEVFSGWLERFIEIAESDPKIGIVGPIASPSDGGWQSIENLRKKSSEFHDFPEYNGDPRKYAGEIARINDRCVIIEDNYLAFFSALLKSEVVKDVGLLSEDFGIGLGDDNDYCIRARKSGWKLALAKNIFVFHNHRTTFKSLYSENDIRELQIRATKILDSNKDYLIEKKERQIKQRDVQIQKKNQQIVDIKNSKAFRIGDLFSRSFKNFSGFIALPANIMEIMLEDRLKSGSLSVAVFLKIKRGLTMVKKNPSQALSIIKKKIFFYYKNIVLSLVSDEFVFRGSKPLVSVVMTTFNSKDDVVRAINSILKQSYEKIELIIVDDDSSDETVSIIKKEAEKDSRIKILQNHFNRGTYWCKNYGIRFARGEYITFHDSDDSAKKDKIHWQLKALLLFKGSVVSVVNYIRVRKDGSVIGPVFGKKERLLSSGAMYRKDVFEKIGFYDSIRFGADSEYLRRVEAYFDSVPSAVVYINKTLHIALTRDEGLTSKESKIDFENGKISDERLFHLETSNDFHRKNIKKKENLYFAFPLRRRPFELPAKMTRNIENNFKVIAFIDFYGEREEDLEKSINSISSKLDVLYLGIEKNRKTPGFLKDSNVIRIDSEPKNESIADKWRVVFQEYENDQKDFYFFSLSVLVKYPYDYIEKMIIKNQAYGDKSVFGLADNIEIEEIGEMIESDVIVEKLDLRSISFHCSVGKDVLAGCHSLGLYEIERGENWAVFV